MAVLPPPSHNAVVVRSLLTVNPEERERILKDVEYNIFAFPAGLLTCDFLSDSGTSAMTDVQWAALMRGDESYGRNWGYYCLLDTFRDVFERGNNQKRAYQAVLTGMADSEYYRSHLLLSYRDGFVNGGSHQLQRPNFFIVPQGRCAEALLFSTMSSMIAEDAPATTKPVIISNGFFDTTGANAAVAGFELQTFTQPGLSDPFPQEHIGLYNNFKGNLDVAATDEYLKHHPGQVSMILMTITNNWAAAQPVSMANIRDASALAKRHDIPYFFDACRFAENAIFIKLFEAGYADKSIAEIVQEMFTYVDGFTISLKKDGLSNMGGVLCLRDEGLFTRKYPGIGLRLKERQILCYGNDSYGGMSGRDLMTAVVGLNEVTKEPYLRNRIGQVQVFAQNLLSNGISVLSPPGGHAVYLDMEDFFFGCGRSPGDFASVGFTLELIKDYGIRAAEAGPFGWEWDKKTPEEQKKIPNLVRFAVPRHVLSREHINYTVAAIKDLHNRRHTIPNVEIARGKEMRLRHFSSGLRPIPVSTAITGTYMSEASKQLSQLSQAINQDPAACEQLLNAFKLAGGKWGDSSIPSELDPMGWISNVSNDHAFFEYSIAMDQKTGKAELRFLIEAQSDTNDLSAMQTSALQLNTDLAKTHSETVSLHRLNDLHDLFFPTHPEGIFAAWHSCASTASGPEWKIYLNPWARDPDNELAVVRKAFDRLGMAPSWSLVESIMSRDESAVYFSLDLSPDPTQSRVKVYISHPGATAGEIAAKHAQICPSADAYEIQKFCEAMGGGGLGPYEAKSLLSCFAFTSKEPERPVGTVHFPVVAYAKDDAEIEARVERYMDVAAVSSVYRERYRKVISAVQRRPLAQGRGIHAWVSLKQGAKGSTNTFYISPELFGTL
ncbi:beta-eliminating lyase [Corynespora cassiicola Philippines]|uniref:Beta-eliminating lyase n=1 Tax=Corynespora cassiicola Philippines TaxID=1448308 RepID=A0A2T2NH14_CORCC|nr:beta-eliminating lyase [Corynespora cassiicola Philippines]